MLYTITCAVIGGFGTYVVCKVAGASFKSGSNLPSGGEMLVLLGTSVGAVASVLYLEHHGWWMVTILVRDEQIILIC